MRNLIIFSLSTTLIACQEAETASAPDLGAVTAPDMDMSKASPKSDGFTFDRSESPFAGHVLEKAVELEERRMDNPFLEEEADGCIYGGIIVGEVDLEIPEAPAYNLDIFDGHDLHVDELVTAQPMSDAGAEQIEIDVQDSQITITMEYAVVDVEIEVDLSPSTPDQGKAEGVWFICEK